jgi:hypothetical protein
MTCIMATSPVECDDARDPNHCADLTRRFLQYFVLEQGIPVVESDLVDEVAELRMHPPRLIIDRGSPPGDKLWALLEAVRLLAIGPEACSGAEYSPARPHLQLVRPTPVG